MKRLYPLALVAAMALTLSLPGLTTMAHAKEDSKKIKVLIVDGQNNHGVWPKTTKLMKHVLEESGRFTVDVARTAKKGTDPNFKPTFSDYQVVLSNYNGAMWPKETQEAFVEYVNGGGGFVVVHAANNAFGRWKEYNEIIGLGGWGGRNENSGPYVYFKGEKWIRDNAKGRGGSHGSQHPFLVTIRDDSHPITQGMKSFMHEKDELYDRMRGPAENMKVLGSSFADPKTRGSGRHEPMLMALMPGKGRVFHTPMGHGDYSMKCVGYITCLLRGAEWAATGKVTIPIPKDFPSAEKVSVRDIDVNKLPEPKLITGAATDGDAKKKAKQKKAK